MKSFWRFLKEYVDAWSEDRVPQHSAAIAYYALFAMAPLLLLAKWLIASTLGPEAVEGQLHEQLGRYMGSGAAARLEEAVRSEPLHSTSLTTAIVGGLTLLFGVTGVFVELKLALNVIWGLRTRDGSGILLFLYDRLLSFGMVIFFGALLIASMVTTGMLGLLSGWVTAHVVIIPQEVSVEFWSLVATTAAFALEILLFATIFKVLPDIRFPWRDVWLGAILTALLFEAGKWGLGWYLGRQTSLSSFAAGSLVIVLTWVYYSTMIVLSCAEFVEVSQRMRGTPHGKKPGVRLDPDD